MLLKYIISFLIIPLGFLLFYGYVRLVMLIFSEDDVSYGFTLSVLILTFTVCCSSIYDFLPI